MTSHLPHSIAAAVQAADQLLGREKEVALLRIDELRLAKACQDARDQSVACHDQHSTIGEGTDRRRNPNNPYLTWSCCKVHMDLRDRKAALQERAKELGVDSKFDALTPVTD